MTESDDNTLMLAICSGDHAPLGLLFARHHVNLFNFFRKLGHQRHDAEDLVQETFLRLLKYAHGFRTDGCFAAWLYRIARNAAHDTWQAHPKALEMDEDCVPIAPMQYEPDAVQTSAELEQRLQNALLRLPREHRELIVLSRIKQLSNEDLAALYDCSIGAIKVRLHRSLEQLRIYFDTPTQLDRKRQV